ncbi:hypothetical protein Vretimale_19760, partial [Volvox reticuliferus]
SSDMCRDKDGRDKPGTVIEGGVRYMSRNVTVIRRSNMMLHVEEFSNYGPDLLLYRVTNITSGEVYTWQSLYQGLRYTHCRAKHYPSGGLGDAFHTVHKDAMESFTFIGYEKKLGVPARHFEMRIKVPILEPIFNSTSARKASNHTYKWQIVIMDFWDTPSVGGLCSPAGQTLFYPVASEMIHPVTGMQKTEYISFTAADAAVDSDAVFSLPLGFHDPVMGCPDSQWTKVPKMSSPFSPAWKVPPRDKVPSLFARVRKITAPSRPSSPSSPVQFSSSPTLMR